MVTMIFTILMKGGILCDSVYSMFDEDNSGSMDFAENMTVKHQNYDVSDSDYDDASDSDNHSG